MVKVSQRLKEKKLAREVSYSLVRGSNTYSTANNATSLATGFKTCNWEKDVTFVELLGFSTSSC